MRYRVTYRTAVPDEEIDSETVIVEPGWFQFITDGITVAILNADRVERIDVIGDRSDGHRHGH